MTFTRKTDGVDTVYAADINELQEGIENLAVDVTRYGATGDGTTDDTTAIRAAITDLDAGGVLLFPAGYTFNITSTLYFSKAMTVWGYGATLAGKPVVVTADDVAVYGLHVQDSDNVGLVSNANRTKFIDCRVTDSANIGIFIETTAGVGADLVDCWIDRCTVNRVAKGSGVTEGGIKVHGYSSGPYVVRGTRITNCLVRMPTSPTAAAAICIEVWGGSPQSVIANNTTYGGAMGVSVDNSDYTVVCGNTHYQPSLCGIENAASQYVAITGNTVDGGNLTATGISLSNTNPDDTVISGNVIYDAANLGIQVQNAENVTVNGNTIIENNAAYGVEIIASDGVTVSGNTLVGKSVGTKAVMINESSTVTISGNTIKDWTEHGILFYGDSAVTLDFLTVSGNVFDNCNVQYGTDLTGGAALGSNVFVMTGYQGSAYTPSNVSTDRAYDANATTTDELADVLGTLIADLQTLGILQ